MNKLKQTLKELGINICDNQELLKIIEKQIKKIKELEESLEHIRKTYRLSCAGVRLGHIKPTDILSESERVIYVIENGIEKSYMID